MRALRTVFPAPFHCRIEQTDLPDTLAPNEILVQTHRSLLSLGTELAVLSGQHTLQQSRDDSRFRFPFYPGYCAVGTALKCGESVTAIRPGDRVFGSIRHASHYIANEDVLTKAPADASDDALPFAELAAIALNAIQLGKVTPGESVAVIGQGLLGLLATGLAKLGGATKLMAFDHHPYRLDRSRQMGTTEVATSAGGFSESADVVIVATGTPAGIEQATHLARTGGRVVLLGSPHGKSEFSFYEHVHARYLQIIGAHIRFAKDSGTHPRNRLECASHISSGTLPTEPLITHRISPNEIAETYVLAARREPVLGVLVNWNTP